MCAEHSAVLQAQPFERTEARTGYANGFKPKTLTTRLGASTFAIPQVRGDLDFYHSNAAPASPPSSPTKPPFSASPQPSSTKSPTTGCPQKSTST